MSEETVVDHMQQPQCILEKREDKGTAVGCALGQVLGKTKGQQWGMHWDRCLGASLVLLMNQASRVWLPSNQEETY